MGGKTGSVPHFLVFNLVRSSFRQDSMAYILFLPNRDNNSIQSMIHNRMSKSSGKWESQDKTTYQVAHLEEAAEAAVKNSLKKSRWLVVLQIYYSRRVSMVFIRLTRVMVTPLTLRERLRSSLKEINSSCADMMAGPGPGSRSRYIVCLYVR